MNGQWADFTKQKCFLSFSISNGKPSILLAFWDFLWYDGNREKKDKKGAYEMIRIAVVDDEKAICDELLFFLQEYEMKFKAIFDIS